MDVLDSSSSSQCVIVQSKDVIKASVFKILKFSENTNDSIKIGLNALQWLIGPINVQDFLADIFGKKALIVRRNASDYYQNFFSVKDFIKMIQKHYLEFTTNINVALYKNGTRTTFNSVGRVYPHVLKQHFANGLSVQCVNPQTFNKNIWYLCEILQEIFCSFVGANNYITPKNAEGFAPHWDDVDAFLMQIEGRKHWTICAPSNEMEALPIESSENFTDEILMEWPVVFNGWLEPGDILYIPRGFIHKANTGNEFSHHITLSVCQKFIFAEFLQKSLPNLLKNLIGNNVILRTNLPPFMFDMTGVADVNYSQEDCYNKRVHVPCVETLKLLPELLKQFGSSFVDAMADDFMKTALPPLLTPEERKYSCLGNDNFNSADILSKPKTNCFKNSYVRLIRRHAQRLIYSNENEAYVAHRMANSLIFEGRPEVSFAFPLELEEGFLTLVKAYPKWIKSDEVNLTDEKTESLIALLYNNCLLLTKPFESNENLKIVKRRKFKKQDLRPRLLNQVKLKKQKEVRLF